MKFSIDELHIDTIHTINKIHVSFIVNHLGNVENVKIEKSSGDYLIDKQVKAHFQNMPLEWTPGKLNGKTTKVQYLIPFYIHYY